ncbi:hypothetical protein EG68_02733 [Paragonimus skrjabini miyazakii]|uniref:C2H2-type domain-containing protein n=1 Tax=Paragonimus skrjabini miyazakii TaxID=59628 RepID=A0A8S9YY40_9TREM|nr:hypothetical protein EG68_02733 [Paragonimus skrjabini miyazakii]
MFNHSSLSSQVHVGEDTQLINPKRWSLSFNLESRFLHFTDYASNDFQQKNDLTSTYELPFLPSKFASVVRPKCEALIIPSGSVQKRPVSRECRTIPTSGKITQPRRTNITSHSRIRKLSHFKPSKSLPDNNTEDNLSSPITGVRIVPLEEFLSPMHTAYSSPISSGIVKPADEQTVKKRMQQRLPNRHHHHQQRDQHRQQQQTNLIREQLSRIPNRIGDYVCRLCTKWFPDALALADHRCPRMTCLAYPCEKCGKMFNCPANRASHQRWHRPRLSQTQEEPFRKISTTSSTSNGRQVWSLHTDFVSSDQQASLLHQSVTRLGEQVSLVNTSQYGCINASFRASKTYREEDGKAKRLHSFSVEALLA